MIALALYVVGAVVGVVVLPVLFLEYELGDDVERALEGCEDWQRVGVGSLAGLLWPLLAVVLLIEAVKHSIAGGQS